MTTARPRTAPPAPARDVATAASQPERYRQSLERVSAATARALRAVMDAEAKEDAEAAQAAAQQQSEKGVTAL